MCCKLIRCRVSYSRVCASAAFLTCCFNWRELFAFLHIHFIGAGCRHVDTYTYWIRIVLTTFTVFNCFCFSLHLFFFGLILIAIVMRFCIFVCICMQFLFCLSAISFVCLSVYLSVCLLVCPTIRLSDRLHDS